MANKKKYLIEIIGESYGSDIVELTNEEYKKFYIILDNCCSEYVSTNIQECPDIDKIISELNIKSINDFTYQSIDKYIYNTYNNTKFTSYVYNELVNKYF